MGQTLNYGEISTTINLMHVNKKVGNSMGKFTMCFLTMVFDDCSIITRSGTSQTPLTGLSISNTIRIEQWHECCWVGWGGLRADEQGHTGAQNVS
jgi:hypothetical protein